MKKKKKIAASEKLMESMTSKRQMVADRAISAWKEESMQKLVGYDKEWFFPKLVRVFYQNKFHFHKSVRTMNETVLHWYKSKDKGLWERLEKEVALEYEKEQKEKKELLLNIQDSAVNVSKFPQEIVKNHGDYTFVTSFDIYEQQPHISSVDSTKDFSKRVKFFGFFFCVCVCVCVFFVCAFFWVCVLHVCVCVCVCMCEMSCKWLGVCVCVGVRVKCQWVECVCLKIERSCKKMGNDCRH